MTDKQRKVGRPAKVYKHLSPFTDKPIPAAQYNSEIREFRRLNQQSKQKKVQSKEILIAELVLRVKGQGSEVNLLKLLQKFAI